MATDVDKLMVRIEANMRGYERALQKMQGDTRTAMRQVEKRSTEAVGVIERSFNSIRLVGWRARCVALPGHWGRCLTGELHRGC